MHHHHHHHHHHRHHRRRSAAWLVVVPLIAVSACGDDDTETTATTTATTTAATASTTPANGSAGGVTPAEPAAFTPDPALTEYCTIAAELIEQDGFPTADQLAAYQAAAPSEIAEPVAVAVTAIEAADGDFGAVFTDDAAAAALGEIEAFEAEACGLGGPPPDPSVTEIDPNATRIDVTAADYEYDVEPPTTAGRYSFVMTNHGAEVHLMVLVQLEEGATAEEVIASEGEVGMITSFESEIAPPGATVAVTADLTPGRWVLVCPVPNAEGTQHHLMGMVREFEVA